MCSTFTEDVVVVVNDDEEGLVRRLYLVVDDFVVILSVVGGSLELSVVCGFLLRTLSFRRVVLIFNSRFFAKIKKIKIIY